nr:sensor histidine kinase [uncultured Acetatifactor sp.]
MPNKQNDRKRKKLKTEIIELLFLSFAVSAFFYLFLSYTSQILANAYLSERGILLDPIQENVLYAWMKTVCFFACMIIFIVIFLVLFSQKISYLLVITDGIRKLQEKQMDFVIELEGNDELTLLAESINYLSLSQRQLLEKEEALRKEREDFIHSLSHDIRTPLTSILSYSEYLEGQDLPTEDDYRAYASMVKKKAQQIKVLSEQLLGKKKRKPEKIENGLLLIEQLAAEWCEDLEDEFSCRLDLKDCGNFQAYLDINELRRIFDNLLSNVERYARPSGEILLVIKTIDGCLSIVQKNEKRQRPYDGESLKLGIRSIRSIAGNYEGTVTITEDEESFLIEIIIPLNEEIQNSSELSPRFI